METNDKPILELMKNIDEGKIQLPDFQRGCGTIHESAS